MIGNFTIKMNPRNIQMIATELWRRWGESHLNLYYLLDHETFSLDSEYCEKHQSDEWIRVKSDVGSPATWDCDHRPTVSTIKAHLYAHRDEFEDIFEETLLKRRQNDSE